MKTLFKVLLLTVTMGFQATNIFAEDVSSRFDKKEFTHDESHIPVPGLVSIGTIGTVNIFREKIDKAEKNLWKEYLGEEGKEFTKAKELKKEAAKAYHKSNRALARAERNYKFAKKSNVNVLKYLKAEFEEAKLNFKNSEEELKGAKKRFNGAKEVFEKAKQSVLAEKPAKFKGLLEKLNKLKWARKVCGTVTVMALADFLFRAGVVLTTDQQYPTGPLPEYEAIEIIYNNSRYDETSKSKNEVKVNNNKIISKSKSF